jgi:hypothetical protein
MLADGKDIVTLMAFAGECRADGDSANAWKLTDSIGELLVERDDLLAGFVGAAGRVDLHGEDVVSCAANIDDSQTRVSLEEQACGDEQDDGETYLKAEEDAP